MKIDVAAERAASLARQAPAARAALMRRRAFRALEFRWNATERELRSVIRETFPELSAADRGELLALTLEIQGTERRKIDPRAVEVRPPEREIKLEIVPEKERRRYVTDIPPALVKKGPGRPKLAAYRPDKFGAMIPESLKRARPSGTRGALTGAEIAALERAVAHVRAMRPGVQPMAIYRTLCYAGLRLSQTRFFKLLREQGHRDDDA